MNRKILKLTLFLVFFLNNLYFPTFRKQSFSQAEEPIFYRQLVLKIRNKATFKVAMPSGSDLQVNYELKFGTPLWDVPVIFELSLELGASSQAGNFRQFWDKIFVAEDSFLQAGGEKIPLTCVFVDGLDNRSIKDSPLQPDFLLKIFIVAQDFNCAGPLNPGWPTNGARKELWDTYIYYEVRDPTIMLPVESRIRYRWSEFSAILEDHGSGG